MTETDAHARVRDSFARQAALTTLGAELREVADGRVAIALPPRAGLSQQHGFVHGGIVVTIADSAAGYAAMTTVALQDEVLTIEIKANFLRPAIGELLAVGQVVRAGRSIVVAQADVFAGGDAEPVAIATATLAVVPARRLAARTAEDR